LLEVFPLRKDDVVVLIDDENLQPGFGGLSRSNHVHDAARPVPVNVSAEHATQLAFAVVDGGCEVDEAERLTAFGFVQQLGEQERLVQIAGEDAVAPTGKPRSLGNIDPLQVSRRSCADDSIGIGQTNPRVLGIGRLNAIETGREFCAVERCVAIQRRT